MEFNKANTEDNTKTKLRIHSFPQLPIHALREVSKSECITRIPLNTLYVFPGTSKINNEPVRQQSTPIATANTSKAWYLNIFRDDKISRDKVDEQNGELNSIQNNIFTEELKLDCNKNTSDGNLKRTHSQVVKGLSPIEHIGVSVKRQLNFDRVPQDFAPWKCSTSYNLDIYRYLMSTEKLPKRVTIIPSMTRAFFINWMIEVNDDFNRCITKISTKINPSAVQSPAVIQTACWLFDSYLNSKVRPVSSLMLVTATCLWIAQKFLGQPLLAWQVGAYTQNAFTSKQLLSAEKRLLISLNFPCIPIVPHDYISYLSRWCDDQNSEEIELAATFICTSTILTNGVYYEYASVIGASAVKNALELLKKEEQLTVLHRSDVYRWAEEKSASLQFISSVMRKAVQRVACPDFKYRAPFNLYNKPPLNIAQRIVSAAVESSKQQTN